MGVESDLVDSLDSGRAESILSNTSDNPLTELLLRLTNEIIEELREELNKSRASGNLQQSIIPTKVGPELIDVTAPFYWKYINYGVNGTLINRGAPTHGSAPSTGVSFHDAIKKWIYDKGIAIPEGMTHNGLAYAIQGKLKTEGQKATHFFDKVVNKEKKDYMKESISNLIGQSIKLVIKKPK